MTPGPPGTSPGPVRIALATARSAWREDEDAALAQGALDAAGADASPQVWDDPEVDWGGFDLVVVRSTWDYVPRRREYLAWADRVAGVTTLANPADVLRWNTDKRYLADLAAAGVPVVPTSFLAPGAGPEEVLAALPHDGEFVVKPTVSAGSKDTTRYAAGDLGAASSHAGRLLGDGRHVMVQPYLGAVDTHGETGMVFVGGRFSHAFRKGPLLEVGGGPVSGLYAREAIDARTASAAELALARHVLDATGSHLGVGLLYARVDVLPGPDGAPVLLELELTEPSFFLATDPAAPERMAAAFVAAAERARTGPA